MGVEGRLTGRRWAITLVAALSVGYALVMSSLTPVRQWHTSSKTAATNPGYTRDVASGVVDAIAKKLGNIPGLNELVVLPSSERGGYTVSATIILNQEHLSEGVKGMKGVIDQQVQTYFQDVYGAHEQVVNAQVYFMQSGNIVAGAGLGADSYHQLAVEVSTHLNLAQLLGTSGMVTNQGVHDRWFQANDSALQQ